MTRRQLSRETLSAGQQLEDISDVKCWDYIVVGAGSAGCAVANRISESSHLSVLVLEAGSSDRSPMILAPAASDFYAIGKPRWDWCFMTDPDSSRFGRRELWPRGKVLGGSSSINGMIYVRGHRDDYDRWAADGAGPGWSYQHVLPYFRRAEDNDLGESEFHGVGGPLSVQRLRYVHPLTHRFVDAAVESGVPFNPDVNGVEQHGVGFNQATQRQGWRHSSARAYLWSVRHRSNLTVLTHAHVTRILFKSSAAAGVEYRRRGVLQRATARREIILSAGSIGSPHLLMCSGIGPARMLEMHGVQPVHNSPGVGENLQEHPGAWLTFRTTVKTLNSEKGLFKQALHGLNWLVFGRGPATSAGAQAVAFLRSGPEILQPDIQLHFMPVGYRVLSTHIALYDEPTVSVLVNVCRPSSRGRISLQSADPETPPRIEMPLLRDPQDLRTLIAGCRLTRKIMGCPAISEALRAESDPGARVGTDEEWEGYLRQSAVSCYHPVGTCRMGSGANSVVDSELRVRGVNALRVADASVMPTLPSGNTNAAAVMIGEKAADLICNRDVREACGARG